jgi:hypothetical protein
MGRTFAQWRGIWRCGGRAVLVGGSIATLLVSFAEAQQLATPEQKRACTPDVYRLCPGEIPNPAAITACLRRKRASLSEACRAVFEQ